MIAGKLIAGLLGLLVAGIPGLVFGIVVGHLFDRGLASVFGAGAAGAAVVREEFFRAIFVLMGYIAKADGRVSEEEVAHTQALFHQLNLNDEQRNQAILLFKKGSDPAFQPRADGGRVPATRRWSPDSETHAVHVPGIAGACRPRAAQR